MLEPTPTPARPQRLRQVQEALRFAEADWLWVPASADLLWLTGAHARETERMVLCALPAEGDAFLIAPRLEAAALATECPRFEVWAWEESEDPCAKLLARTAVSGSSRVLLGEGLGVAQVLRIAARTQCEPAARLLGPLRAVKDEDELRWLEAAAAHADQIVEEAADLAEPGMTERAVARFILSRFEALGDDHAWCIVASGANSAHPHHASGDRVLQPDDVLLLDLGASHQGLQSDITRTFCLGEPSRHVGNVFTLVDEARRCGIAAARSGATAESVDRAV